MAYQALIVARFLKSPSEERCREEEEFEQLPEATERTLVQWADALPVFGNEVGKASRLVLAGGGRFFPVALETARELEKATGISAFTQDVSWAAPPRLEAEARAIVLSCSRCRVKAQVNRWAVEIGKSSGAVMALTDAADKNLLEKSRLSLLLPSLGESAASVLELAVGGSLVSPIVRAKARTK